jgi:hypothetical protein
MHFLRKVLFPHLDEEPNDLLMEIRFCRDYFSILFENIKI